MGNAYSWGNFFNKSFLIILVGGFGGASAHSQVQQGTSQNASQIGSQYCLSREEGSGLKRQHGHLGIRELLNQLTETYVQNQEAFAPFAGKVKSLHDKGVLLYQYLCSDDKQKASCDSNKDRLVEYFESRINRYHTYNEVRFPQNMPSYYRALEVASDSIRGAYREALKALEQELGNQFLTQSGFSRQVKSPEDFDKTFRQVLRLPHIREKIKRYQDLYFRHAKAFPGQVLLSPYMQRWIEGTYYDLQYVDLIQGVEELSKYLRKAIHDQLARDPEALVDLKDNSPTQGFEVSGKFPVCVYLPESWKSQSELHFKSVDPEDFSLIKNFHGHDVRVIRLLAKGLYQKAIWRLRALEQKDAANGIERWLESSPMRDDRIETIGYLGGGVTLTKLIRYPHSLKAVYKPVDHPSIWNGFIEWAGQKLAHYENEIVAYRLDRLMNLNYVPITRKVDLIDGPGSAQYFMENATIARKVNELDLKNPKPSRKLFQTRKGRAIRDGNILLFDWLISDWDRNLDNYLYQGDGQIVLVDHAMSFLNPFFSRLSTRELKSMVPSRRVFRGLAGIEEHPEQLDAELKGFLNPGNIELLRRKITYFNHELRKLILKEGKDKVFAVMDERDRKLDLPVPEDGSFF